MNYSRNLWNNSAFEIKEKIYYQKNKPERSLLWGPSDTKLLKEMGVWCVRITMFWVRQKSVFRVLATEVLITGFCTIRAHIPYKHLHCKRGNEQNKNSRTSFFPLIFLLCTQKVENYTHLFKNMKKEKKSNVISKHLFLWYNILS